MLSVLESSLSVSSLPDYWYLITVIPDPYLNRKYMQTSRPANHLSNKTIRHRHRNLHLHVVSQKFLLW